MTNADKLRQMTDEELYAFRFKSCPGENCVGQRCLKYSKRCKDCWLAWLKEETQE